MVEEMRIRSIELSTVDMSLYPNQYAGGVVLSAEARLLLQCRWDDGGLFAGQLATFGGRIEEGESPGGALVRELFEELGAVADQQELVALGVLAEAWQEHCALIHLFFWHDRMASITGCYEGQPKYFDRVDDALVDKRLMADVRWGLLACKQRGLLR